MCFRGNTTLQECKYVANVAPLATLPNEYIGCYHQ